MGYYMNVEKKLNIRVVAERMVTKGLSQADIAQQLDVSRPTISAWFKPEKFPRPRHLLKLAEILGLTFEELVLKPSVAQASVAFRKSGNYKITDEHLEKYHYVGRLLRKLSPFLPFDTLSTPAVLKDPKVDYDYIQLSAKAVRERIGPVDGVIEVESLINFFNALQAVLVPVLWGDKHYKNATHIFLPDLSTTWIFINLDTKIFDFKFWLCHELGHAKAPQLTSDEGEQFADGFAGALLFPEEDAKLAYETLSKIEGDWKRADHLCSLAKKLTISPLTIHYQIDAYVRARGLEPLGIEKSIFPRNTNFNKEYKSFSEKLFKTSVPKSSDYLRVARELFKTPFFECLAKFLNAENESPKFIANVLDISLDDAYGLFKELT
jgi:transcriptional regulator with XRE-family HTH domain